MERVELERVELERFRLVCPSRIDLPADAHGLTDETAHQLYYIPRPGEDMTTADVEAPVLEHLIVGTGVQNVTISGIEFAYTTFGGVKLVVATDDMDSARAALA